MTKNKGFTLVVFRHSDHEDNVINERGEAEARLLARIIKKPSLYGYDSPSNSSGCEAFTEGGKIDLAINTQHVRTFHTANNVLKNLGISADRSYTSDTIRSANNINERFFQNELYALGKHYGDKLNTMMICCHANMPTLILDYFLCKPEMKAPERLKKINLLESINDTFEFKGKTIYTDLAIQYSGSRKKKELLESQGIKIESREEDEEFNAIIDSLISKVINVQIPEKISIRGVEHSNPMAFEDYILLRLGELDTGHKTKLPFQVSKEGESPDIIYPTSKNTPYFVDIADKFKWGTELPGFMNENLPNPKASGFVIQFSEDVRSLSQALEASPEKVVSVTPVLPLHQLQESINSTYLYAKQEYPERIKKFEEGMDILVNENRGKKSLLFDETDYDLNLSPYYTNDRRDMVGKYQDAYAFLTAVAAQKALTDKSPDRENSESVNIAETLKIGMSMLDVGQELLTEASRNIKISKRR